MVYSIPNFVKKISPSILRINCRQFTQHLIIKSIFNIIRLETKGVHQAKRPTKRLEIYLGMTISFIKICVKKPQNITTIDLSSNLFAYEGLFYHVSFTKKANHKQFGWLICRFVGMQYNVTKKTGKLLSENLFPTYFFIHAFNFHDVERLFEEEDCNCVNEIKAVSR